jgi:hypothetical protein
MDYIISHANRLHRGIIMTAFGRFEDEINLI